MHGIHEAEALGLAGVGAVVVGVAQETGRHAGPEGEDDKGQQVAGGHGAAAGLVQGGTGRVPANVLIAAELRRDGAALAGGGDEVEDDEEEDGARDVDKGVNAVDPVHHGGHLQKVLLDWHLDEDVEALLQVDELERMLARHVDGSLVEGERGEGAADLVHLQFDRVREVQT